MRLYLKLGYLAQEDASGLTWGFGEPLERPDYYPDNRRFITRVPHYRWHGEIPFPMWLQRLIWWRDVPPPSEPTPAEIAAFERRQTK